MFDFLIPKIKVRYFDILETNIEQFQIFGISQINPYCNIKMQNEAFITLINIANDSRNYDEKEGLILTKYFTVRKCPKCKKTELIPVEMKINASAQYLKNEEDYTYEDYFDSRYNFPTRVRAYCNCCSTCFEILIKNEDCWIKEAKKIKNKNLIDNSWQEYRID